MGMQSYFLPWTLGLLSLTLLAPGCGGDVAPTDSHGAASAHGAGGSGATGSSASATGSGATGSGGAGGAAVGASGSSGGGVSVLACSSVLVSFSADVAPLFQGCSGGGCHQGAAFKSQAGTYSYLVGEASGQCTDGRLRVAPGDPENSYLIDKLTNHDLCGGVPMPKGLDEDAWQTLSEATIQTIYDWICSGAKDD